jgi:glycosyltransferase involved in cell wall biosynthesis
MTLSICIFAHNEQWLLHQCIGALGAAAAGEDYRAHILVNGSTDETYSVAKALAAADRRITAHFLPVADKANAWNDYVYRIAPEASAHIFIDGDIRPSAGAFPALSQALQRAPRAFGASALPATGRSRRAWAARLITNHYISGNLYALSGTALSVIRAREIRLPFGAKGEDGLISYLLLTDLIGGSNDSHRDRIVVAEEATFEYDSLTLNWRDIKTYHHRLLRYSERHHQKIILYRLLKQNGVAAMPDNIYEIYSSDNVRQLRPRLDPVNFWYDRVMLKRVRRQNLGALRRV